MQDVLESEHLFFWCVLTTQNIFVNLYSVSGFHCLVLVVACKGSAALCSRLLRTRASLGSPVTLDLVQARRATLALEVRSSLAMEVQEHLPGPLLWKRAGQSFRVPWVKRVKAPWKDREQVKKSTWKALN